jgi:hypothetical protein
VEEFIEVRRYAKRGELRRSAQLILGERLLGGLTSTLRKGNCLSLLILQLLGVAFRGFRLRLGCDGWLPGGL